MLFKIHIHIRKYEHTLLTREGLVMKNVEDAIETVGYMGRERMYALDVKILHILLSEV